MKTELTATRNRILDVVRGLATLMIVAFHFEIELDSKGKNFFPRSLTYWRSADWGGIAVFMFFILSGAVHYLKYSDFLQAKKYYKSRLLSIFPMFYIAYALAAVAEICLRGDTFTKGTAPWKAILTVIACDGYIPALNPTFYLVGEWFTTVILFIYLIFPLIRIALREKPILFGTVLLALDSFFYFDIWNPLGITLGGNCFYAITAFSIGYMWNRLGKAESVAAFIMMVMGAAFAVLQVDSTITNITLAVGVWGLIMCLGRLGKANNVVFRFFSVIATYSYAIYLTHHFVIRKTVLFMNNGYMMTLTVIVLTTAFSWLVYRLNRLVAKR